MKISILQFLFLCQIFNVLFIYAQDQATINSECLDVQNTICVGNGVKMFAKDNVPKELIGHWTFDDKFSLDHSGKSNHMLPSPKAGPQSGGKGYSAFFNGNEYSNISHNTIYETEDMTLCFWLFLLRDSTGSWRTIIHKGNSTRDLTPTIMLWPKERRLHIRVSTDQNPNEGLDSKSVIPMRRWTHITISFSLQLLHLYVNGILDNEIILKGSVMHNRGNFHIGKDSWHLGTMMYLDDLRIYNTMLKTRDIQILSGPAMVLWAENFATLGCDSCNYNQALNSCSENYHLCSIKELYAGGYHVARIMGWFRLNTEIWTRDYDENETNKNEMLDPNIYKMAICCSLK